MRKSLSLAVAAILAASATGAAAQATVERKAKAKTDQETRIGVFANIKPDCTAGPFPTVTLAEAPQNEVVRVRPGKVRLTNHKTCLAVEVPGYIATYKGKAGFAGEERIALELKSPDGKVLQRQNIIITVGGEAGQAI